MAKNNNTKPSSTKVKKKIVKITKNMVIGDVVSAYPETIETLFEAGFHCAGCYFAGFETIEQGAMVHGMDAEELCKKLNETIKKAYVRRSNPPSKSRGR